MRLLLLGPITGLPKYNAAAFDAAAESLRARGHTVVSPIDLDREAGLESFTGPPPEEWVQEARRRCYAVLVAGGPGRIEGVALLTGWWGSANVRREVEVARSIGLAVLDAEHLRPAGELP